MLAQLAPDLRGCSRRERDDDDLPLTPLKTVHRIYAYPMNAYILYR